MGQPLQGHGAIAEQLSLPLSVKYISIAMLKSLKCHLRRTVSGRRFQSRGTVKKNDFSRNLELVAVTTRSSRVDDLSRCGAWTAATECNSSRR